MGGLIQAIAPALANFELPHLGDRAESLVMESLGTTFRGGDVDPHEIAELARLVEQQSGGKVTVGYATQEEFSFAIKGTAVYLSLTNKETGRRQLFTFGPYLHPVEFATPKGEPSSNE